MQKPGTILITGGTGLIGNYLCSKLTEKGYRVAILSRNPVHNSKYPVYYWNAKKNIIEQQALENADHIIHLAGVNIGNKKWNKKRKKEILNSRVHTAQLIFKNLQNIKNKPRVFISASATGYYGAVTSKRIFYENDPPAGDFLGETCRQWEEAADLFEKAGMRTVKIRTGIVLAKHGGALDKMLYPLKFGLTVVPGNGRQFLPWIHIDDLCNIYIKAIEDLKMKGVYNAVAPEFKTYNEVMQTTSRVHRKTSLNLHIPAVFMKTLFGEMAGMLLTGSRISSDKIMKAGYHFIFPDIEKALENLLV